MTLTETRPDPVAAPAKPRAIDLSKKAILVRFFNGKPGLSASSKVLTDEAAVNHKADRSSVRGAVVKLPAESLAEIVRCSNEARLIYRTATLPWEERSYRLCPLVNYPQLRSDISAIEDAYLDAVEDVLSKYEVMRQDYHRRVNDLAQDVKFPTYKEMKEGFRWELRTMPLADTGSLKFDHLNEAVVEEIRESTMREYAERLSAAQTDIIERLTELVGRVKAQTSSKDGRIFDSLIGNIEEAVETLPALNISGDPEITRLIERVRHDLVGVDTNGLRDDDKYRKATSKVANSVLDDLRNFGMGG